MVPDCRFSVDVEEGVTGSHIVRERLVNMTRHFGRLREYEENLQDSSSLPECVSFESELTCLNFLDIPMQSLGVVGALLWVVLNLIVFASNSSCSGYLMTFQSMPTVPAAMAYHGRHIWRSNHWAPHGLSYLPCHAIPNPILMLPDTVHLSSSCLAVSSGANCQEGNLLSLVKTGLSRTTVGLAPIYELVNSCMWDWPHLPHHTLTSARYMHPGTPHIVITTSNCVAYGAHFYNLNVLHCTFAAMVAEHFVGRNAANTEHMRAPLLLFKGLDAILEEHTTFYGDEGWPASRQSLSPDVLTGMGVLTTVLSGIEHLRNLAWLILLIHYMPQLAPQVSKNTPGSGSIWQESSEFANDHSYIEDRARVLYDLCCAENHGGSRFKEILCRIETWAWRTIRRFQQNKTKRIPPKRRVKPVCICKMHQVDDSTFICTKSSDVQVLENVHSEYDDFYNYPYVSLPTLMGVS